MTIHDMPAPIEIGSYSNGTLRSEDLAEAFMPLAKLYLHPGEIADLQSVIDNPDSDDASEIINETIDSLTEHCPDYCYFGTHPGDGADFGCWPDFDAIDHNSDDVLKISDLSDLDSISVSECQHDLALLVNDHGNATLYRLSIGSEPVELWSIV